MSPNIELFFNNSTIFKTIITNLLKMHHRAKKEMN